MLKTAPIVTPIIGEDMLSKDLKKASLNAKKFAQGMAKVGSAMTKWVSVPVAGAGLAALKFSTDFNAALANVATLIPGQREKLLGFKSDIQALSIETGKSTEDLAGGAYEVVSALGGTEDAMSILGTSATAATAGLSTTKEAFDLLSAVAKGYNDTTGKAIKNTANLAFQTVKLGKTSFAELAASLGSVVPNATALDISQKELFGTFATLTGVTGTASEVATKFNSVLRGLINPTDDMTKAAKNFGFTSSVAMTKFLGFRDSVRVAGLASAKFKVLSKAVKEFGYSSLKAMIKAEGVKTTIDKLSGKVKYSAEGMGALFGRAEAMTAMFSLLGAQAENFKIKIDAMGNVVVALSDAYKEQTEGINATGHAWNQIKARMIVFAQRVGDKLIPVLSRLFDKMEPWLEKLERMDDATLEWGLNIAKWAVLIGPSVLALGRMSTSMLGLINLGKGGGFAGLNNALGGIGSAAVGAKGKVSGLYKALGLLGKAGLIGEVATAAVGLGTLVHETVIEPREKKKAEERETFQRRRAKAERWLEKGIGTPGQRLALADQLSRDLASEFEGSYKSFTGDLMHIIGPIIGEKTPTQKFMEEYEKVRIARDKLLMDPKVRKMSVEVLKKEPEQVKIEFKSDIPGKATIKRATTGRVMGGML